MTVGKSIFWGGGGWWGEGGRSYPWPWVVHPPLRQNTVGITVCMCMALYKLGFGLCIIFLLPPGLQTTSCCSLLTPNNLLLLTAHTRQPLAAHCSHQTTSCCSLLTPNNLLLLTAHTKQPLAAHCSHQTTSCCSLTLVATCSTAIWFMCTFSELDEMNRAESSTSERADISRIL